MMLSAAIFGAGAIDASSLWRHLASILGTAAVWAQHRAQPERDALDELTMRLRQPARHAVEHPFRAAVALKRKADRRR